MPDNSTPFWVSPLKQPSLNMQFVGDLHAGACVRGWVTFESAQGVTPKEVAFADLKGHSAKWLVPSAPSSQ